MPALGRTIVRLLLNHGFRTAPQLTKMVKSPIFAARVDLKRLAILTAPQLPFLG
jgi:hypothetical protein